MRVCFFQDSTVWGGGERWTLCVAKYLEDRGHTPLLTCPKNSPLALAALDAQLPLFPYRPSPRLARDFHRFLSHAAPDILYVTVMGRFREAEWLAASLRLLPRPPPIVLRTGLDAPLSGAAPAHYGAGIPEVRALHVVSQAARRRFLSFGLPARFVQVMRQGVDLSAFQPGSADKRGFLIACVARLEASKGHVYLLDAFREVHRRVPEARLVLAGQGSERRALVARAAELGIAKAVRFPGHLDDVAPLLNSAGAFCLPSLTEGFPNALAEAMAMRLPVVATCVGGVPEIVRHGSNGLLCEPRDARALARSLLRLAADPALRQRLGAAAQRTARRRLDFHKRAAAWLDALVTLAGTPRPALPPRA